MDTDLDKKTAEHNAPLSYSAQIDKFLNGSLKSSDIISLGEIPQWLKAEGAQGNELIMTQETLQNCVNPSTVKMKVIQQDTMYRLIL